MTLKTPRGPNKPPNYCQTFTPRGQKLIHKSRKWIPRGSNYTPRGLSSPSTDEPWSGVTWCDASLKLISRGPKLTRRGFKLTHTGPRLTVGELKNFSLHSSHATKFLNLEIIMTRYFKELTKKKYLQKIFR